MFAAMGFAFVFIVLASGGIYLLSKKIAEEDEKKHQTFDHTATSIPSNSVEPYRKPRFFKESKMDEVDQYPDYLSNNISSPGSDGFSTKFKDY